MTSNSKTKLISATLVVGEQSKGITLSRSQVQTMLDLSREASQYRRECSRLLMARSYLVRLDAEGLAGVTRTTFTGLYLKKLRYELQLTSDALTLEESETLRLLEDVVSVRHLAKWRAQCVREVEKQVEANASRVQAQLDEAKRQQSWWGWATQGTKGLEAAVLDNIRARGSEFLTEDEAKFMSNVVATEINLDSAEGPTLVQLSFRLPHFSVVLHEDSTTSAYLKHAVSRAMVEGPAEMTSASPGSGARGAEEPFIVLELTNVEARLNLKSAIDCHDKDAFEWRWTFRMSDFVVRYLGAVIVSFRRIRQQSEESVSLIESESQHDRFAEAFEANSGDGKDADNPEEQRFKDRVLAKRVGTLWQFERHITKQGNRLGAFIRMAPLEIHFEPKLLRDTLVFFAFESRKDALAAAERQNLEALESEVVGEQEGGHEFYEGVVLENYERLCVAATDSAPDQVHLDIALCAPIVYCNASDGSRAVVYFGRLRVNTEGFCGYNDIVLAIEMNATQLTCITAEGKTLPVLRPIPITIHLQYLPVSTTLTLDIEFLELFTEVNPEAFLVLASVLSSATRSLARGRRRMRKRQVVGCRVDQTGAERGANIMSGGSVAPEQSEGDKGQSVRREGEKMETHALTSLPEVAAGPEIMSLEEIPPARGATASRDDAVQLTLALKVFVKRVGFSVYNRTAVEVLRVGAIDLLLTTSAKKREPFFRKQLGDLQQQQSTGGTWDIQSVLELQGVYVSDPSTKTPLFVTLTDNDVATHAEELFGRLQTTEPLAAVSPEDLADISVPSTVTEDSPGKSLRGVSRRGSVAAKLQQLRDFFATSIVYRDPNDDEVFEDAQEWRENAFEVRVTSLPIPSVVLQAASSCEIHWQKDSIRQIIQTAEDLRSVAEQVVDVEIAALREQGRRTFKYSLGARLSNQGQNEENIALTTQPSGGVSNGSYETDALEASGETEDEFEDEDNVSIASGALGAFEQTLMYVKNTIQASGTSSKEEMPHADSSAGMSTDTLHTEDLSASLIIIKPQGDKSVGWGMRIRKLVSDGLPGDGTLPEFGKCSQDEPMETFRCTATFRTASIQFWKDGKLFGRSALMDTMVECRGFSGGDAEMTLHVGCVEVLLNNRRIISSSVARTPGGFRSNSSALERAWRTSKNGRANSLAQNDAFIEKKSSEDDVLSARIRLYRSPASSSQAFSACVSGHLSSLTCLYFQKDLNALLAYLSDGILDVILWRSYEAAYNLASSSYFLFLFHIDRPMILLPEDKACIPQLHFPSDRGVCPLGDEIMDATSLECCHIVLDFGRLTVRNGYTYRPALAPLKGPIRPVWTGYFDVEGFSAMMKHGPRYGFFSEDVNGPVFNHVMGKGKIRAGDPLLVDLHFSELCLNFNREQLTLLIDVLNENCAGLGYSPAAVEVTSGAGTSSQPCVVTGDRFLAPTADLKVPRRDAPETTQMEDVSAALDKKVYQLLAMPPLRISTRVSVDALRLNVAFTPNSPLTVLCARTLFIACDVSLYTIYLTYQFKVFAESLVAEDERQESRNYYKRFLECLPKMDIQKKIQREPGTSAPSSCRGVAESEKEEDLNYGPPTPYVKGEDPPGTLLQWMRPGVRTKCLDTNLSAADADLLERQNDGSLLPPCATHQCPQFMHAISIGFESSTLATRFSVELFDPTVYVFTVGMQDLLDWVLSSFSFSTMRRFPKPVPPVVSQATKPTSTNVTGRSPLEVDLSLQKRMSVLIPQIKPFIVDVQIRRGIFNIFSQVERSHEPVIQWQNDLHFVAESIDNSFFFRKINVSDCIMRRMDIQPLHENSVSEGPSSRLVSRPLFDSTSCVIICETFHLQGSGVLESLYDPTTKQHYTSVAEKLDVEIGSTVELVLPRPTGQGASGRYRQPRKPFDFRTELSPPDSSQYAEMGSTGLSRIQIDVYIPEFALHLSSRDFAVLLSAFQSLNTDLPSVSPGIPAPPIVPAGDVAHRRNTHESMRLQCVETSSVGIQEENEVTKSHGSTVSFADSVGVPASQDSGSIAALKTASGELRTYTSCLSTENDKGGSSLDKEALSLACQHRTQEYHPQVPQDDMSLAADESPDGGPPDGTRGASQMFPVHRYCQFGFRFAGFEIIVLDDLHDVVSPIVKTRMTMKKLALYVTPRLFYMVLLNFRVWVDCLSQRLGEWEPCVEQFHVTLTCKMYKDEEGDRRLGNACVLEDKNEQGDSGVALAQTLSHPPFRVVEAGGTRNSSGGYQYRPGSSQPAQTSRFPYYSDGKGTRVAVPKLPREWYGFSPMTSISVVSELPLWINVTPQMCQLLAWFVGRLSGFLGATSLASGREEVASVNEGPAMDQKEQKFQTFEDGQDEAEDALTSTYRFVNLTGRPFLAFSLTEEGLQTLDSLGQDVGKDPTDSTLPIGRASSTGFIPSLGAELHLVPTSVPRSADRLLRGQALGANERRPGHQQSVNVFLATDPPEAAVRRLQMLFPFLPRDYLERNLLVTQDEEKTLETFLSLSETTAAAADAAHQLQGTTHPLEEARRAAMISADPSPSYLGRFPAGMEAVVLTLSRSSAVKLPPPCRTLRETDTDWELRAKAVDGAHRRRDIEVKVPGRSQLDKSIKEEVPPTQYAQEVGIVLSPYPTYKLLLLTTTLHIRNASGIPIEIAFMRKGSPDSIPLVNMHERCIPSFLVSETSNRKATRDSNFLQEKHEGRPSHFLEHACRATENSVDISDTAYKRESGYPLLNVYTTEVTGVNNFASASSCGKNEDTSLCSDTVQYSVVIPNDHLLSVPQSAFQEPNRAYFVFRPAAPWAVENAEADSKPFKITPDNGWTIPIDTADGTMGTQRRPHLRCSLYNVKRHSERLACEKTQSSYVIDPRAQTGRRSHHALDIVHKLKGNRSVDAEEKRVEQLYFSVVRSETTTPLPVEQTLTTLSIYPSMTLVNACPIALEAEFRLEGRSLGSGEAVLAAEKRASATVSTSGFNAGLSASSTSPSFFATFQPPPVPAESRRSSGRKRDTVRLSISAFSVYYVYNLPPIISSGGADIMQLRCAALGGGSWSTEVKLDFPALREDDLISRVQLRSASQATVEVEVYKQPSSFVTDYVPGLSPEQRCCLLSCPRWCVDRTGLGLRLCQTGIGLAGSYPVLEGVVLLGNSQDPTVELVLPLPRNVAPQSAHQGDLLSSTSPTHSVKHIGSGFFGAGLRSPTRSDSATSNPKVLAELPAVGAFSNCAIEVPDSLYYTFCLQAHRIHPQDTAGAVSRCITIAPKYLLCNGFQDLELYVRQADIEGGDALSISIPPGQTVPLYWRSYKDQLRFEFRPGDAYFWSTPVFPCEEYVGGTNIALFHKSSCLPHVFNLQIASQNGIICTVIRSVQECPKTHSSSIILKNHLADFGVLFRAYHREQRTHAPPTAPFNNLLSGGETSLPAPRQAPKVAVFYAPPGGQVLVAWPRPYEPTYMCNVVLAVPNAGQQHLRGAPSCSFLLQVRSRTRRLMELKPSASSSTSSAAKDFWTHHKKRHYALMETKGNVLHIDLFATGDRSLPPFGKYAQYFPLKKATPATPPSAPTIPVNTEGRGAAQPALERVARPLAASETAAAAHMRRAVQIALSFSQIGVSLVSDRRREELLFAEVSAVCGILLQNEDNQLLEFCVGDIQVDSQLEESEKPVLLANRHGERDSAAGSAAAASIVPLLARSPLSLHQLLPCLGAYALTTPPSAEAQRDLGGVAPRPPDALLGAVLPHRSSPAVTHEENPETDSLPRAHSAAIGAKHESSRRTPASASFSALPDLGASDLAEFEILTARKRRSAVVQQSSGDVTELFLHLWVEREAVSSSDLHLRRVLLSLDDLEVDIDAEMLNGIQDFTKECLDTFQLYGTSGVKRSAIYHSWVQKPLHVHYEPPAPTQVIVLDEMCISRLTIVVWCSFLLDKVTFLSDFLKMGLRVLMVSQVLELKGAPITLEAEEVNHTTRGSLSTFLLMLKGRYLNQAVNSIGVILGYSSLANIPRAPFDLVRGTVGLGLTVADNFSSGIGNLLSNLTFDSEYINNRQKERLSAARSTQTVKEGFNSATRDLKEGFFALGDILTKPIGGAQKEGFSGLIKGLGKGVVGTLIKPVDKLGQAVSNVASGLRAEYVTRPLGGYKCRTQRRRKPRMLWGAMGCLRPYNSGEADLRESLALRMAKDVLLSITVSIRETGPPQHLVLLFYPKRIAFVDLYAGKGRLASQIAADTDATNTAGGGLRPPLGEAGDSSTRYPGTSGYSASSRPGVSGQSSVVGRARTLWTVDLNQIMEVRASTHGISIQTERHVRLIPCQKGSVIKRLYEELKKAERRVKAVLQLGRVADWHALFAREDDY